MTLGRFHSLSRLLVVLTLAHLPFPTHAASKQSTVIAAGDLRLTLRSSTSGIRLERLLDAKTGQDFFTANPLPLFSLTLCAVGSTNQTRLSAQEGWNEFSIRPHARRLEL